MQDFELWVAECGLQTLEENRRNGVIENGLFKLKFSVEGTLGDGSGFRVKSLGSKV
jgi:hypothetical protein